MWSPPLAYAQLPQAVFVYAHVMAYLMQQRLAGLFHHLVLRARVSLVRELIDDDAVRQHHDAFFVALPDRIITDWAATSFEALAAAHLEALVGLGQEIILLGTGNILRFPRPEILRPLIEAGIGLEVMDVQAACRTFNILVAEERRVGAALLLG